MTPSGPGAPRFARTPFQAVSRLAGSAILADTGPEVVLVARVARAGRRPIGVLAGLGTIMCGFRALRFARRQRQQAGIATAGLFLGLLGNAAWVVASIALLNTTESLLRIHGRWPAQFAPGSQR